MLRDIIILRKKLLGRSSNFYIDSTSYCFNNRKDK